MASVVFDVNLDDELLENIGSLRALDWKPSTSS